jgi:hypothetical protein
MLKSAAAIFFPTALGEKDLEGGNPSGTSYLQRRSDD